MEEGKKTLKRLLLVSNRLLVTFKKLDGGFEFVPSSGGLATALRSFHTERGTISFGWPGSVPQENQEAVEAKLCSEHNCYPVFISERLLEQYYEGFSNGTLWPLLHSFPPYATYSASDWDAYKEVNAKFCERIMEVARNDDTIWIHDYHLMMLPKFLRERLPRVSIGFFLHIPFPHYEILRLLPQHKEIIESLLCADLVGFHTHDSAQALLGSVRRLLGYDNTLGQLTVGERAVQVDVFPMGIDFERYSSAAETAEVQREMTYIRSNMGSGKLVFSVSRLDYTKGIPQSLDAIDEFFRRYPAWRGEIVFVLLIIPSREGVERYASLKREVDEIVGRIVSTYGTMKWTPIRYIYRNLEFPELVALFATSDIALITPLRDGMNLVSKEYLATRNDGKGVLILSEMAGAAKELLEAVIVNPNSKEEIADALARALSMDDEDKIHRNTVMRQRLKTHGVKQWVEAFLGRLDEVINRSKELSVKMLDSGVQGKLFEEYAAAHDRLVMLDYDGTLVPFAGQPELARPDTELLQCLQNLAAPKRNRVVIISGRERGALTEWLGSLNILLVAEHGGWMRDEGSRLWKPTLSGVQGSWKQQVRPTLDLYANRIPGSFVEEKDFSLVWHYRKAETESASFAGKELLDTLTHLSANLGIRVLPGDKAIEIRTMDINKGMFYKQYLASSKSQFILAAGDDWTDEDLFAVLPPSAYSIKVGLKVSKARFNVTSTRELRTLLNRLESVDHTDK
ncbi:MAG: bifunctional alpha,alpha-trehalose-phosphate synthase (UDP-forming)/trehalose-phosphatase [Ignavibacteria bacterium]|nr:bifunctional alpha,alpha-trehalose-phosphate synthase (UDP-forming)/trehalose-phosphatase [Ignavibacteria bacterium]